MGLCVSKKESLTERLFELAQAQEDIVVRITDARLAFIDAVAEWVEYEGDPKLVDCLEKIIDKRDDVENARVLFGDNFEEVLESLETIRNIYSEYDWAAKSAASAEKKFESSTKKMKKLSSKSAGEVGLKGALLQGKHRLLQEDADNQRKTEQEKMQQLNGVIVKEFPEAYEAAEKAYRRFWSDLGDWSAAITAIASSASPGKPEISTAERGTSEKYLKKVLFQLGQVKHENKAFLELRKEWLEVVHDWCKKEDTTRSNVKYMVQVENGHKYVKKNIVIFDRSVNSAAKQLDKIVDEELVMLKAFKKSSADARRYNLCGKREERFMRRAEAKYLKNQTELHTMVRVAEEMLIKSLANKREQADKLDTKKGGYVKNFLVEAGSAFVKVDKDLAGVETW